MKLFTTALALLRLGPDYRFITHVTLDPSGDLVLTGSGDPSLSGREFPYRKDAPLGPGLAAIEDLADQDSGGRHDPYRWRCGGPRPPISMGALSAKLDPR